MADVCEESFDSVAWLTFPTVPCRSGCGGWCQQNRPPQTDVSVGQARRTRLPRVAGAIAIKAKCGKAICDCSVLFGDRRGS